MKSNQDSATLGIGTLGWARQTGGILSARERRRLLGDAARLQARILPAQVRAAVGFRDPHATRVDLDRLRIPDSAIAREAEELCAEVSPPELRNHCLRAYAWGTILAQRDRVGHDAELLYITCLLHDLGITDRYRDSIPGLSCFAATSAAVSQQWAGERGWDGGRRTALADAICQHLNPLVPPANGVEAHLMQAGAAFDAIGMRHWEVAPPTIQAVLARHPRLGFKRSFGAAICAQAREHPGTRSHFLVRYTGFGRRVGSARPFDE